MNKPTLVSLDHAPPIADLYGDVDAPFPLDAMPESMRALALALKHQTGASLQLPACAIISSLAPCLGKGIKLESMAGRFVYPNPYFILGVASGIGKSVIAKWTLEKAQIKLAALARSMAESREDDDAPYPATVATDSTDQALARALSANPHHCLAVISAEGRTAIDNLMGRYANGKMEATCYLSGFSGDFMSIHRKQGGVMDIENPCISVFLPVQQDRIDDLYISPAASETGLLARFLGGVAEEESEGLAHNCIGAEVVAEWGAMLDAALVLYRNSGSATTVEFGDEAAADRREFFAATKALVKAETSESMKKVLRRQIEIAHKLALVFHFARHQGSAPYLLLGVDDWRGGCRIVRWFLPQIAMLLSGAANAALLKEKDRVIKALALRKVKVVSEADLKRHNNIQKDTLIRLAMAFPAEFRRSEARTGGPGRPGFVFEHLAA
jgi:hypothetical protein